MTRDEFLRRWGSDRTEAFAVELDGLLAINDVVLRDAQFALARTVVVLGNIERERRDCRCAVRLRKALEGT